MKLKWVEKGLWDYTVRIQTLWIITLIVFLPLEHRKDEPEEKILFSVTLHSVFNSVCLSLCLSVYTFLFILDSEVSLSCVVSVLILPFPLHRPHTHPEPPYSITFTNKSCQLWECWVFHPVTHLFLLPVVWVNTSNHPQQNQLICTANEVWGEKKKAIRSVKLQKM